MLAGLLLALALAALGWFVRGDLRECRRFQSLAGSDARQARYRAWIAKAGLAFAAPALLGLLLLGRIDALHTRPPEFAGLAARLPAVGNSQFLSGVIGGSFVGGLLLTLAFAWRKRRGEQAPGMIGDIGALIPRNRTEVIHAAALSVTAGVTEELAFRLYLPLLLVLVSGEPLMSFALAAALFGAMHMYQGWRGVAATTLVGLVLTLLYLASGSLQLAMLFHALIDLNGLVLRPILGGAWRVSS